MFLRFSDYSLKFGAGIMSNKQPITFFTGQNSYHICGVLAGRSGLLLSSRSESLSHRLPHWGR